MNSPAALLVMTLLAPAASAASSPTPEEAVARTLSRMRGTLRYATELPAPRGPHEWDARRVLAAGTVNGCVESAKAFFALLRDGDPAVKAAYLDSFNAVGDGGHAVVAVTGSDGREFIVDAAAFEKLPGRVAVDEAALAAPIDIRPDRKGRIIQFPGRGDVLLEKSGGAYQMTVYPPSQVFDGPVRSQKPFRTLAELNHGLADYASPTPTDFAYVRDHGLILPFADPEKTSFLYIDPAGGLALHVIYGRFTRLPEPDDAEKREPAARARYARTHAL